MESKIVKYKVKKIRISRTSSLVGMFKSLRDNH